MLAGMERSAGIKPDVISYTCAIGTCARGSGASLSLELGGAGGGPTAGWEAGSHIGRTWCTPSPCTFPRSAHPWVHCLLWRRWEEAMALFLEMQRKGVAPDTRCYAVPHMGHSHTPCTFPAVHWLTLVCAPMCVVTGASMPSSARLGGAGSAAERSTCCGTWRRATGWRRACRATTHASLRARRPRAPIRHSPSTTARPMCPTGLCNSLTPCTALCVILY